ncbi:hypothetical protein EG832_08945, partial [bacterium]|nr:hypothetical protein [bacterium]
MPVSPSYPGVYIEEVPSGVRTIAGVRTSVALFIGMSTKGPINKPVLCTSYSDFARSYSENNDVSSLARYIRLFFLNGGTDCYLLRIANGATKSGVTLLNELAAGNPDPVLALTAKDAGLAGENIRAVVTYSGQQPEATFNMELFRIEKDSSGRWLKKDVEIWRNLTMDPGSPLYAQTFLTQNSKLADAVDIAPAVAGPGFSLSGRAVPTPGAFKDRWAPLFGDSVKTNRFKISVNGSIYVDVSLENVTVTTMNNTQGAITDAINKAFADNGLPGITVSVTFPVAPAGFQRMQITAGVGDVFIRPGSSAGGQSDVAIPLMLGTEEGGIEISTHAMRRPAPNGITFRASDIAILNQFAGLKQKDFTTLTLDEQLPNGAFNGVALDLVAPPAPALSIVTVGDTEAMLKDNLTGTPNGNSDGLRGKFRIIADRINATRPT